MLEFFASFLIFFDMAHPFKTIVAGGLIVFIGMAIYYIATRSRWSNAVLKVFGLAVAAYGAGHVSAVFTVLTRAA